MAALGVVVCAGMKGCWVRTGCYEGLLGRTGCDECRMVVFRVAWGAMECGEGLIDVKVVGIVWAGMKGCLGPMGPVGGHEGLLGCMGYYEGLLGRMGCDGRMVVVWVAYVAVGGMGCYEGLLGRMGWGSYGSCLGRICCGGGMGCYGGVAGAKGQYERHLQGLPAI
jgi:hypothetical protein